ncbi:hypothetical protein SZN_13786 [Streptomyces zinciresistens K42]|uniref:Uncharacterized protein n=1 Tax=Streptomyces zinciresistens K42 TaxID=700597 RepID=G2GB50_9ACTN|nr:hypothetical protein SZN_13786 [Streptomyces zinciresistens K42]
MPAWVSLLVARVGARSRWRGGADGHRRAADRFQEPILHARDLAGTRIGTMQMW